MARSICERAQEHRQDSHIYKHWRITHPEVQEPPKFNIKVVQSFQDALSRQIGEAVRQGGIFPGNLGTGFPRNPWTSGELIVRSHAFLMIYKSERN